LVAVSEVLSHSLHNKRQYTILTLARTIEYVEKTCKKAAVDLCSTILRLRHWSVVVRQCSISSDSQGDSHCTFLQQRNVHVNNHTLAR